MKKILIIILLTFLILHIQAQLILPERDSANRDTISFYDLRISDRNGFSSVEYTNKSLSKHQKRVLTGRYMYKNSNGRTIDMELKDGIAVGDWQYYSSTFQGPIISSTVSFVDGYKNGTENSYSYEWSKETERFESCLSRVIQYNMGKKQHDISYWNNGQVLMESQFDKDGKTHGLYICFNSAGTVTTKGEYVHGSPVGTWEYFTDNSKTSKKVLYKDGLIHTITYHINGKPHISKTTRNRVLEGNFLNLSEKGDTIAYHFYKNGIEQGYQVAHVFTGYWQSRATSYYYTDDKGVIQGSYIQRFFDTGVLRVKGYYNDHGIRDGVWEYYQEDGRLYRTEIIEDGWVRASNTRWLQDFKTGQYVNAQYHLEAFLSGTMPRQVEEAPFFLFSE